MIMETVLIFLLILGLLVFVHEAGHFVAAKRSGAQVLEFGFGFPPRIVGVRYKGTIYSLNWIPLGGFVKIKGESGERSGDPDSFASLPAWKRAIILISGVAMNVVFAAVLLSVLFATGAPTALDQKLPNGAQVGERHVQVLQVVENSPAAEAGLRFGDIIEEIDSTPVVSVDAVQQYNAVHGGIAENVLVRRGSETLTVSLTPRVLRSDDGRAVWGVGLVESGIVRFPWYQAIWIGLRSTFVLTWQILAAFGALLSNLLLQGQVSADVSGPVGIAAMTGQVSSLGFAYLLQFMALLSLNLAIINILPIPALDGGRVLFLLIEKIRGKAVNVRTEALIHNIGFTLLLLLVGLITLRDIGRFRGPLLEFFQRLW